MAEELRFLWNATRGYRFRPWRSPFLRWRMETFSGLKADRFTPPAFLHLIWTERRQFVRFLRWTGEMRKYGDQGRS